MSKIQKDIGFIFPKRDQQFTMPNCEEELISRTQTYQATHDGEGLTLPNYLRSFISFTFGGKKIEDFGIIKVTGGDRINQPLYTNFQDLVSQYQVLDGQFYWGTHHKPLELNYTLSTDKMTQRQLDQFKAWFAPGKQKELIRAEHPNRAIMARVKQPPNMNMLPFEGQEQVVIARTKINVPTTIYKGDITIGFIADDPFWYSLHNLLGTRYQICADGNCYKSGTKDYFDEETKTWITKQGDKPELLYHQYRWYDVNGNLVETFADKDALKIILQDNIPTANMIRIFDNMFLGDNNIVKSYQYNDGEQFSSSAVVAPGSSTQGSLENQNTYAHVNYARVGKFYAPAQATYNLKNSNVNLSNDGEYAYLYYAGNAISYPKIVFGLIPKLSTSAPYYIINPDNRYAHQNVTNFSFPYYNIITIESQKQHIFKFTTPSVWNGYNQAMYIFNTLANANTALTQVKIKIKNEVTNNSARAWAILIIECFQSIGYEILTSEATSENKITVNDFYYCMRQFISTTPNIINKDTCHGIFSFDFKTGQSTGTITYRTISNDFSFTGSTISDIKTKLNSCPLNSFNQKVGDMVRSSYLFLEETNHPDENGLITTWDENNNCVYRISTDYPKITYTESNTQETLYGLINFSILYKNMYL